MFERAQAHVVIVTAFDGDQKLTAQANGLSVSPLDVDGGQIRERVTLAGGTRWPDCAL